MARRANARQRGYDRTWDKLRAAFIKANASRAFCAMCGVALTRGRTGSTACIVDHIVPHKGDDTLRLDWDNLQLLCKSCHDGAKQRQERTGWAGVGKDGWPIAK